MGRSKLTSTKPEICLVQLDRYRQSPKQKSIPQYRDGLQDRIRTKPDHDEQICGKEHGNKQAGV